MVFNASRIALLPIIVLALAGGCDDEESNSSDTAAESGSTGQGSGGGETGGTGGTGGTEGTNPSAGESDGGASEAGAEAGGNAELEEIVDEAVELSKELSEALLTTCECWEGFGFESQEMCDMTLMVEDSAFDRDCLLAALSMDPDAAIENFTCERPGLEELLTCVTAALDVCDAEAFTTCTEAPEADCAELPPEVDMAVDACFG